MSTEPPKRGLVIACLACVYIAWGSVYLAMQVAIEDMGPLTMGGARFLLAGLALYVIATRKTKIRPTLRDWKAVLPIGLTLFLCGNGFMAIAVEKTANGTIASGTVGVVAAMESLWIAILGVFFGVRPTRREILALVSGFIGIVVLTRGPSGGGDPLHFVLLLLSPVLWAVGSLLTRSLKSEVANDPLLLPAMQMICGGICMLVVAPIRGEHLPTHIGLWPAIGFGYCVLIGSLLTFTAYSWLLRNTRPIIATSYAFVNPTIAVLLGAALHGEALGISVLIANVMMVLAIWLAVSRPWPRTDAR